MLAWLLYRSRHMQYNDSQCLTCHCNLMHVCNSHHKKPSQKAPSLWASHSQSDKLSWLSQAWRKTALDFNTNTAPAEATSASLCSREEIIQILNRRQNLMPLLCPLSLNPYFNCQVTDRDLINCPKPHSPMTFLNVMKELDALKIAWNFRVLSNRSFPDKTRPGSTLCSGSLTQAIEEVCFV